MFTFRNVPLMFILVLILTNFFSCTKDSDLLSEYALNDEDYDDVILIRDDIFQTDGSTIVLDVLSNDSFPDNTKVKITEISNPSLGTVQIREDNRIVYTPESNQVETNSNDDTSEDQSDSNESTDNSEDDSTTDENSDSSTSTEDTSETDSSTDSDTFTYTTETENEDGTTTTEDGTVTVEFEEETTEETSSTEEETTSSEETEETQNNEIAENARFVATNGNGSNDGLSEDNPWSIEHAFNAVRAGQTVYVKAGNYGNKILILGSSGSAGNPIRFKGYRTNPEDIQAQNGSTFNYGDNLDSSKMPLFSGSAPNGDGTGIAMRIDGNHVQLSNLQFTKYEMGIIDNSTYNIYDNIVISKVGDFRPGVSGFADYAGVGIRTKGSYNKITNSIVINAGAEALALRGCSNCEISNSKVYADDETNPTDYFILMTAGTTNSRIVNCIATRKAGLSHFGHGIVLKGGANNNTVSNSTVINTNIELSFSDVFENTVVNCAVVGRWSQDKDVAGGVLVANGAHHNSFSNISIDNVYGALRFQDWQDGSGIANDAEDAGNNNEYNNIQVTNSEYGIDFNEFEKREGVAWNNNFTNCSFKNLAYLFRLNRPNSGNKLSSCAIENIPAFSATSKGYGYQMNSNTIFENNSWVNLGFSARD